MSHIRMHPQGTRGFRAAHTRMDRLVSGTTVLAPVVLVTHAAIEAPASAPATTVAVDTTGATLLVAAAGFGNAGGANATFADSKGNTWTRLSSYGGNGSDLEQIAYVRNPTVGAGHTFTITSYYAGLAVAAFSGVSGALDLNLGASGVQPGTGTPAFNNELIVTGFCYGGSAVAVNQGFTIAADSGNTTAVGGALAYLVQTAAAALNPTWTGTSLVNQNTAMASFQRS